MAAAKALLAGRPHLTIACNYAGRDYPERIDAWVTLHPELMGKWERERAKAGRNTDYRLFAHTAKHGCDPEIHKERWKGSSGLYMAQIALWMRCRAVILAGVPMDKDAGHFNYEGPWSDVERYRSGFRAAAAECGPSIRSMSGWTARLFGEPDGDWLTERVKAQA